MKRKYKIILATYGFATFLALGLYSFAASRMLTAYELSAEYASARAFEETVLSVEKLSQAVEKSLYATDSEMRSALSREIYAHALAAESAMSVLPFSNYELEQLAAFINCVGDYALQLETQQDKLEELSARAEDFSTKLRQLQGKVNSGELLMDTVLQTAANIGSPEENLLSESLLDYQNSLEKLEIGQYDGKYSPEAEKETGDLSQDEMRALAAEYAGADASQMRIEYDYAGTQGRKCYSVGDTLVCASPSGVESLGQTRLVSEVSISKAQAEKAAQDYLKERGFENLSLSESSERGAVLMMKFAVLENGVLWPDNYIKLSIAMDDGSVYSFDSRNYKNTKSDVQWSISPEEAAKTLPDILSLQQTRRLILSKPNGEAIACYKFDCINNEGQKVNIYINASSGQQHDIETLQ